jgi:hypothetical protein
MLHHTIMWICVLKISPKSCHFQVFWKSFMSFLNNKSNAKHWLQLLINAFENSNFIIFISNYCTCFHNVLRTLSSKHICKMCNINIIFDTKTWKSKHLLQFLSLLSLWMCPHLGNPLALWNQIKPNQCIHKNKHNPTNTSGDTQIMQHKFK